MRVADVGCGSGILAICAARLGAAECKAYDIDPVAVKVANENIKDSGLEDRVSCEVSDLLRQVDRSGGAYNIICANIVADIIIRMMPDVGVLMDENSVILASGIIVERSEDVISGFEQHGFKIVERIDENGWCALAVMKK
jgi:ribosomal protein L11 methyltransferase